MGADRGIRLTHSLHAFHLWAQTAPTSHPNTRTHFFFTLCVFLPVLCVCTYTQASADGGGVDGWGVGVGGSGILHLPRQAVLTG